MTGVFIMKDINFLTNVLLQVLRYEFILYSSNPRHCINRILIWPCFFGVMFRSSCCVYVFYVWKFNMLIFWRQCPCEWSFLIFSFLSCNIVLQLLNFLKWFQSFLARHINGKLTWLFWQCYLAHIGSKSSLCNPTPFCYIWYSWV